MSCSRESRSASRDAPYGMYSWMYSRITALIERSSPVANERNSSYSASQSRSVSAFIEGSFSNICPSRYQRKLRVSSPRVMSHPPHAQYERANPTRVRSPVVVLGRGCILLCRIGRRGRPAVEGRGSESRLCGGTWTRLRLGVIRLLHAALVSPWSVCCLASVVGCFSRNGVYSGWVGKPVVWPAANACIRRSCGWRIGGIARTRPVTAGRTMPGNMDRRVAC